MSNDSGPPDCPECAEPLTFQGLVLAENRWVCRAVWQCRASHAWWHWADRPSDPLEACSHSDLFR